jgi:nicotinamidase-related amidase
MATIRGGSKSALVVVDVQAGVMRDASEAPRVIANVGHAVGRARSQPCCPIT